MDLGLHIVVSAPGWWSPRLRAGTRIIVIVVRDPGLPAPASRNVVETSVALAVEGGAGVEAAITGRHQSTGGVLVGRRIATAMADTYTN